MMKRSLNRLVIVTHRFVTSPGDDLRAYEMRKSKEVMYIVHGFADRKDRRSFYLHDKGFDRIQSRVSIDYRKLPDFLVLIKDFLYTVYWVLSTKKRWDLLVAMDSLNFVAGYTLKRLGFVGNAIFWTTDFTPVRFSNRWKNSLYHRINRFGLAKCDAAWYLSERMNEGQRKGYGISLPEKKFVVPRGAWSKYGRLPPFESIEKHTVVFLGHLLEKQGVQLALRAIPHIVEEIPDFKLVVIGGGHYETRLKHLAKQLNIERYVEFTGVIRNHEDIEDRISNYAMGLAPYDKTKDTWTYFADPGKIREYAAAGLPVILTSLPYNAKELENLQCAIIIDYDEKALANAIVKMMKDESLLRLYKENAARYSIGYDWNRIFQEALARLESN